MQIKCTSQELKELLQKETPVDLKTDVSKMIVAVNQGLLDSLGTREKLSNSQS